MLNTPHKTLYSLGGGVGALSMILCFIFSQTYIIPHITSGSINLVIGIPIMFGVVMGIPLLVISKSFPIFEKILKINIKQSTQHT